MRLHSKEWYDRLATLQEGYAPNKPSKFVWGSGEDEFLRAVREHLKPEMDVGESGCAEGTLAIELAPLCRSIVAYDRVESFIDPARKNALEAGVTNVRFLCADSSADTNGGTPRLPFENASLDMIISRRGPLHWIPDARRVVRSGGILIQLCMRKWRSPPPWNQELPQALQETQDHLGDGDDMRSGVEARLQKGELDLHSCWEYDVPMYHPDPCSFTLDFPHVGLDARCGCASENRPVVFAFSPSISRSRLGDAGLGRVRASGVIGSRFGVVSPLSGFFNQGGDKACAIHLAFLPFECIPTME